MPLRSAWGLLLRVARLAQSGRQRDNGISSRRTPLRLEFATPASSAEDGQLVFVGIPAGGRSAAGIVGALQQANAPNAVPDYVLPGASVGYVPGYGEAFQTTPNSADATPVRFEVVITCAVPVATPSAPMRPAPRLT